MTTVFTNGCFDLLHPGHTHFLYEISLLGDKLIVAVNSDASVRRLKGPGRPFFSLTHRLDMLRAVSYVDEVIPFDTEEELAAIVKSIKPDIMAKDSSWEGKPITGAEHAKKLIFVPRPYVFSTTWILSKLKETYGKESEPS